jgi:hypothetical protein
MTGNAAGKCVKSRAKPDWPRDDAPAVAAKNRGNGAGVEVRRATNIKRAEYFLIKASDLRGERAGSYWRDSRAIRCEMIISIVNAYIRRADANMLRQ